MPCRYRHEPHRAIAFCQANPRCCLALLVSCYGEGSESELVAGICSSCRAARDCVRLGPRSGEAVVKSGNAVFQEYRVLRVYDRFALARTAPNAASRCSTAATSERSLALLDSCYERTQPRVARQLLRANAASRCSTAATSERRLALLGSCYSGRWCGGRLYQLVCVHAKAGNGSYS